MSCPLLFSKLSPTGTPTHQILKLTLKPWPHELCHCSQRTSKGWAHVLKTEQVLNKLLDQGISHQQGRGHWIYLVIIDHFATFTQAFATANKSGKTAATKLCRDFALRRKFSGKISRDLGRGIWSWAPAHPVARLGMARAAHPAPLRTKEQLENRTCAPCTQPDGLNTVPLC